jgi:hypothetical protein
VYACMNARVCVCGVWCMVLIYGEYLARGLALVYEYVLQSINRYYSLRIQPLTHLARGLALVVWHPVHGVAPSEMMRITCFFKKRRVS